MGNNSSRVAPARSVQIFDSQTRARYKNQREANQLRRKLRCLDIKENEALSRLTFEEQDAKTKLHELQYDQIQRQLYKSIETRREKKSNPVVFSIAHLDKPKSPETTNLLLHQLNESKKYHNAQPVLHKPDNAASKAKALSAFVAFQLQYSSKSDVHRDSNEHTERYLVSHARTLQKETELMKKSIRISVAKASRDSNVVARRDTHHY